MFPNTRVLLIDKESGIAHLKMADNMGQPSTQYFKFEAINADGTPFKQAQEQKAQIDMSDFIKKSDLEGLGFVTKEQHNALLSKIENLQKLVVMPKQGSANNEKKSV